MLSGNKPFTWAKTDPNLYHHMASLGHNTLTHWGQDKMAAVFQTTFSSAFSWMKMYEFRLRFYWSLFPRVQLTISQAPSIVSDNGLAPNRRQAIIWSNDGLISRRIYASLGLNELMHWPLGDMAIILYYQSLVALCGASTLNFQSSLQNKCRTAKFGSASFPSLS